MRGRANRLILYVERCDCPTLFRRKINDRGHSNNTFPHHTLLCCPAGMFIARPESLKEYNSPCRIRFPGNFWYSPQSSQILGTPGCAITSMTCFPEFLRPQVSCSPRSFSVPFCLVLAERWSICLRDHAFLLWPITCGASGSPIVRKCHRSGSPIRN